MEVEKLTFIRKKYGVELLLDCQLYSAQSAPLPKHPIVLDFYGIFIITSGSGEIYLDNHKTSFKKGVLLFFQPGQIRQWHNISDDIDGYFLGFESEFIETFFQDMFFIYRFQFFNSNISCCLDCENNFFSHLINLCNQINGELKCLQDDSHHLLRSLLYNILIEINRKFIDKYKLSLKLFQDNKSIQFLKILNANFRIYHKVEDYAQLLKISRSQLNIHLKTSTGKPASILIKERLIIEIKRELFTNKSIKEICFEINFSDVPNFIRFFKKATGVNPKTYRLNNTK
ncbi:helix-turn-helix domain-containing protein [Bacteroidota bacterium]